MAQPSPERRPRRDAGARLGIMALLKTEANSAPMVASMKPASATATAWGAPGAAHHSMAQPRTSIAPKPAIHGLRGPDASATAPSAGSTWR